MKFVLAALFLLSFSSVVLAQSEEGPQSGGKCQPFNDVYKKLEANGFAPVFLGEKQNTVELAILKNKAGNWMLLKFIKQNGAIIACLLTEGEYGASLLEEHPAPTTGI